MTSIPEEVEDGNTLVAPIVEATLEIATASNKIFINTKKKKKGGSHTVTLKEKNKFSLLSGP